MVGRQGGEVEPADVPVRCLQRGLERGGPRPGEDAHYTAVVGADDQRDEQTGEYPRFRAEWAAIMQGARQDAR